MNNSLNPGLSEISVYLPRHTVGNDEIIKRFGFKKDFLVNKIGIEKRHVAGPDEAVSDMAVKAGQKLIKKLSLDTGSIELIVLCTQNPDYNIPGSVNCVQNRLDLPKNIAAFEINDGCSGFIYSLSMVKSIMITENLNRAILITSEAYSKVIDPDDRHTVPIFGDAATASFVEMGGFGKIGRFVYGSDGSGFEDLIVRGGGSRYPNENRTGTHALYMNGRAIFNFMMTMVPNSIEKCLTSNGFTIDDINYFLFHQASRYMLENLGSRLGIPKEKIPLSLKYTGNTVSSSIPITMDYLGGPAALKGKTVLLSGFGTGLSWATTVLTF